MNTRDLMIRCLAVREENLWVGICLPFDLAVQAESYAEMKTKLDEQILHYLQDALGGQDKDHAAELFNRRAPLKYYLQYYCAAAMEHIRHHTDNLRRFKTLVPLTPATC